MPLGTHSYELDRKTHGPLQGPQQRPCNGSRQRCRAKPPEEITRAGVKCPHACHGDLGDHGGEPGDEMIHRCFPRGILEKPRGKATEASARGLLPGLGNLVRLYARELSGRQEPLGTAENGSADRRRGPPGAAQARRP